MNTLTARETLARKLNILPFMHMYLTLGVYMYYQYMSFFRLRYLKYSTDEIVLSTQFKYTRLSKYRVLPPTMLWRHHYNVTKSGCQSGKKKIKIIAVYWQFHVCCPPPFAKAGDIKTHFSVCRLSLCLSITKTLTWLISSEVLMIQH